MRRARVRASLFLLCSIVWSQAQTREIKGIVRDQDGYPLSGAVVQLESVRTLEVRSFITPRSGKYYFAGALNFEDYQLRAHYRNRWSDNHYLSRFNSNNQAIVNLTVTTPD